MQPLIEKFNTNYGTNHRLVVIINKFFGPLVNVTGLLTGRDILDNIITTGKVLLPAVVLNQDQLFLDDLTLEEFKNRLKQPLKLIHNGTELYQALIEA